MWADTYTKLKDILEDAGFTQCTELFDFENNPKGVQHKAFMILAPDMTQGKEIRDINAEIYRIQKVQILIGYVLNTVNNLTVHNQIPTDIEGLSLDFDDNTNIPTGAIWMRFVDSKTRRMDENLNTYIQVEINLELLQVYSL